MRRIIFQGIIWKKLDMAMNNNIDAVLTELGWNDGFRIPVANEENKRLEEEVI